MHPNFKSLVAGVAIALLGAAVPSHAIVLTGSYGGLLSGNEEGGSFENRPYTGTFSIDLEATPDWVDPDAGGDVTWWGARGIAFTLTVPGWTYALDGDLSVSFRSDATSQTLAFGSLAFYDPWLVLRGGPGALFDAPGDLRSLRLNAVDLASSMAGYVGHMTSGEGPLSYLQVDGASTPPVPEPAAGLLMLAGLAAVYRLRRHPNRAPPVDPERGLS